MKDIIINNHEKARNGKRDTKKKKIFIRIQIKDHHFQLGLLWSSMKNKAIKLNTERWMALVFF